LWVETLFPVIYRELQLGDTVILMHTIEMSDPENKKEEEYYLSRRNIFLAMRDSSIKSFDKHVIYFALPYLWLSIAFLDKIGKPFDSFSFYLMSVIFLFFLFPVIFTLLGFYLSEKNADFRIKDIDDKYKECRVFDEESKSPLRRLTIICNRASLFFLIAAVCLFVIYGIYVNKYDFYKRTQKQVTYTSSITYLQIDRG